MLLLVVKPYFSPPSHTHTQTADVEHLQDLERAMRAVVQETLWFLSVKKISSERECRMRECVQGVEGQIKKVISAAEISTAVSVCVCVCVGVTLTVNDYCF